MNHSSKVLQFLLLLLACASAGFLFAMPEFCAQNLQDGLALCTGPLLVSLFPFLIIARLFLQCNAGEQLGILFRPVAKLIGVQSVSAGSVLLIGALGGFAPAATAASEAVRTGRLSSREASALLPACICSGPSFVILTVGGQMLGSRTLGICLFAAQLLAGYLTAAFLNRFPYHKKFRSEPYSFQTASQEPPHLDTVIAESSIAYLKLCGFVLYFRLLAAGFGAILPQPWQMLPAMLLEVCSGCDLASRTGWWASSLCCAALSLQGVSALLQVRTICPRTISFRPLLIGRLLHLPLSLALFFLFLPGGSAEVFRTMEENVVALRRVPIDCAFLAFLVCCLFVCELCANRSDKKASDERKCHNQRSYVTNKSHSRSRKVKLDRTVNL